MNTSPDTQNDRPMTEVANMPQVKELQALAKKIDGELAEMLSPDLLRLVQRRIMTARLLEAQTHLQGFVRACSMVGA